HLFGTVRCVGFNNPSVPWSELVRKLGDKPVSRVPAPRDARHPGDGGDSPAWSRKRAPYRPAADVRPPARPRGAVPYAELHAHSNFSFLDGASRPEELVEEAVRLGLEALALTDHDGFYGVVRFAEAARAYGLPTVFGAEVTLGVDGPFVPGRADPAGEHLVVLARDPVGYGRLARALSEAQLAGEKGAPRASLDLLADIGRGRGTAADHWLVLTGCRKGTVPAALEREGPRAARRALDALVSRFGRANVAVELWDHGHPLDSVRNDA